MNRPAVVLLAALALLACDKEAPPPEPAKPAALRAIAPDRDSDNLLNIGHGASVVSRTGEIHLDNSAVQAIDGMQTTFWSSSPGWPAETLVYSLLAPARIRQIGISPVMGDELPQRVSLDGSLDGKKWTELATIRTEQHESRQLASVTPPVVAQYIRVRVLDQQTYYAHIRAVHVLGDEAAPPQTPPFTGCWTLNGRRALLTQDRARITGVIETNPPTYLDGGTDNRVAMVMWVQGPAWGYAALTRTPDGAHVTGLRFYNDVKNEHIGESWMGDRVEDRQSCLSLPPGQAGLPVLHFLQTAKHYSVFGLVFDDRGRVVEELSGAALDTIRELAPRRIVAHEFTFDDHEQNKQRAAAKIAGLRAALQARGVDVASIEFTNSGSTLEGHDTASTVQRLLATRVDIIPAR